jgi:hypothetical protein
MKSRQIYTQADFEKKARKKEANFFTKKKEKPSQKPPLHPDRKWWEFHFRSGNICADFF